MFVTNITILAVELKKLLGTDCNVDLLHEKAMVVRFTKESGARSGCIDCTCADNGACVIKMVARYTIRQEQLAEIASKLRDGDAINVHYNGISVYREYTMTINMFNDLSIQQIEHTAKDIMGTVQSL